MGQLAMAPGRSPSFVPAMARPFSTTPHPSLRRYDPEPPTANKQKWQPRRPMVECIAKIHDYIASRPALLSALQAEGQQFVPWYRMFPGAAYIAAKIEQWYWENYKHTYWFWSRYVQHSHPPHAMPSTHNPTPSLPHSRVQGRLVPW